MNFAAEPTATWTTRADKSAMLDVYADFCPLVGRMLRLVPVGEVCEWKLRVHRPLRTWVEGNVALVGDACHPALPVRTPVYAFPKHRIKCGHGAAPRPGKLCCFLLIFSIENNSKRTQGAAQAIEDGAVLAVVMGKLTDKKDLNAGLLVYEVTRSPSSCYNLFHQRLQRLRKARAESIVDEAAASGRALLLADPEAQAERDEAFHRVQHGGPNPDKWVDRAVTDYLYGFDCVKDAEARYGECFAELGVRACY